MGVGLTAIQIAQLAAAAAAAAGTAYSVKSQSDVRKASNDAALNELQKKEQISKDSEQLFNQTAATSNPVDAAKQAESAAADQLAATKQDMTAQNVGFGDQGAVQGLAQSTNPVVKEGAARSLADALQVADAQMKARATLTGLGAQRMQRMQQLTRAGQQQDMLNNFMVGAGQVGQVGQAAAKQAGAGDAMLGDALTGLGQVGMAYAGTMKTPNVPGSLTTAPISPTDPYAFDLSQFQSKLGPSSASLFSNAGTIR